MAEALGCTNNSKLFSQPGIKHRQVMHFSVASQEQISKSTLDEFPKGCNFFFLEKLLYGSPVQGIGHSNDKLDLHIIGVLGGADTNEGEASLHSKCATMGNPETVACQRKSCNLLSWEIVSLWSAITELELISSLIHPSLVEQA
ncbi:uncharacterized protein VP01_625g6 [Puccinia sorghi]|uniref:Uncharacterized protein n=1 Tax=Puccinia sorghi TaxID=27349 RepID=A0A0L6UGG9_9BASI|nr:uncharacterized protein VP01_625g6 [Puccinia sorghi]